MIDQSMTSLRQARLIEDITIRTIASQNQQGYQNDFECETVQLENAETVVRNTSITSVWPVEAYNLEVVARDIFATPNSLNLQVGRESKSPFSNSHTITLKLCSQSSPTAVEIHSLPRTAALKSP
jgi:hypothetical protein